MISVVVDDFSSFDDERCFTAEHVFKTRILNSWETKDKSDMTASIVKDTVCTGAYGEFELLFNIYRTTCIMVYGLNPKP